MLVFYCSKVRIEAEDLPFIADSLHCVVKSDTNGGATASASLEKLADDNSYECSLSLEQLIINAGEQCRLFITSQKTSYFLLATREFQTENILSVLNITAYLNNITYFSYGSFYNFVNILLICLGILI